MDAKTVDMKKKAFHFLFDNVVFPPQLPQIWDPNEWEHEDELLSFLIRVTQSFIANLAPIESDTGWCSVLFMLRNLKKIEKQGSICEDALFDVFKGLAESSKQDILLFVIASANWARGGGMSCACTELRVDYALRQDGRLCYRRCV